MNRAGVSRAGWIGLAAALLYAGLALASGLDRRAEFNPALAARLPWPFAHRALAAQGEAQVASRHFRQALQSGEAAVRDAPVDPVNPALLGAARLELGDAAGAERAFLVAGQLGWRVPMTQGYWMQRALDVRDFPVAALRLDALLRQSPEMISDYALLQPFESDANGQRALIDRLALRPGWLTPYANLIEGVPRSAVPLHAAALQELARRGVRVGCDTIGPPVISLTEVGDPAGARALWRSHCAEAGGGVLGDPELVFVRSGGARSAFEWDLIGNSDLDLTVLPPTSGQRGGGQNGGAVEIHNASGLTRTFLRQMVVVPAGSYRVSWRTVDAEGQPSALITLSTGCGKDSMSRAEANWNAADRAWQAELHLQAECKGRWIEFAVQPGPGTLRLSRVSLVAARAP
ncbi:MAG: hypothetical protein ABI673_01415 [Novosphingobium sp.]